MSLSKWLANLSCNLRLNLPCYLVSKLLSITLLGFCFLLASCVIRPLYQIDDSSIAKLSDIEIAEPKTRFEQLIANEIDFLLSDSSASTAKNYILKLNANYTYSSLLEDDNKAEDQPDIEPGFYQKSILYASLNYQLCNRSGKILLKGDIKTSCPYNKVYLGYANLKARQVAQHQAAIDLAEQLNLKLITAKQQLY